MVKFWLLMEAKMNRIYLDNASTTFPKPAQVADAVYDYISNIGSNINRGCYEAAYSVEEMVFETRELICDLFNGDDSKNVVFTKNVTESLNIILKGFLKNGDHVLVSSIEHNSVMRPLNQLAENGVSFSRIPCNEFGEFMTAGNNKPSSSGDSALTDLVAHTLDAMVTPATKAVVMTHASNVCGTIMPIKAIGKWCKNRGIRFIVDCAQTAGCIDIDMKDMNIDALAFTGHKGLLGPQGIGGFVLKDDMVPLITPLISGGSGSISHTEDIPSFMPDKFEAGTPNLPGIVGLRAGLLWLKENGISNIREHELALTTAMLTGLKQLENENLIKIIGLPDCQNRTGVISIQTVNKDMSEVAYELDDKYKIMTRVGLHCAPIAHKSLGTYPAGTIRFSFGWNNSLDDVSAALNALEEICHGN